MKGFTGDNHFHFLGNMAHQVTQCEKHANYIKGVGGTKHFNLLSMACFLLKMNCIPASELIFKNANMAQVFYKLKKSTMNVLNKNELKLLADLKGMVQDSLGAMWSRNALFHPPPFLIIIHNFLFIHNMPGAIKQNNLKYFPLFLYI